MTARRVDVRVKLREETVEKIDEDCGRRDMNPKFGRTVVIGEALRFYFEHRDRLPARAAPASETQAVAEVVPFAQAGRR